MSETEATRIPSCGLCGVLVLDFTLHRAVCDPCAEHDYWAQWGRCGRCGHAETAVCHVAATGPSGLLEVSE